MRQRQIQANNFRLRSIDKARSKLSYPDLGNSDFFRSPSIEEKWQQLEQEKQERQGLISSIKRHLSAKKTRINKILGDRPPDWDGSLRPPGKEPDFPSFSGGGDTTASVALGGDTPMDLKGGQAPASFEPSIVRFDALSPESNPFAWKGEAKESFLQKLDKGTYFGTEHGEKSAQWYADRYVATDSLPAKVGYGVGGLVASLWTPDTYQKTVLTLQAAATLGTVFGTPLTIGAVPGAGTVTKLVAAARSSRIGAALSRGATRLVGALGKSGPKPVAGKVPNFLTPNPQKLLTYQGPKPVPKTYVGPRAGEPWNQKWVNDDMKDVVDFYVKPGGTAYPSRGGTALRKLKILPERYLYNDKAEVIYLRGNVVRWENAIIDRGW
ncbi:MAG: hypothetical protein HQ512_07010 [Rhodospirillales bacterium]|nr:hypothetical protein [Rhodospirillales bacterium]